MIAANFVSATFLCNIKLAEAKVLINNPSAAIFRHPICRVAKNPATIVKVNNTLLVKRAQNLGHLF